MSAEAELHRLAELEVWARQSSPREIAACLVELERLLARISDLIEGDVARYWAHSAASRPRRFEGQ
jgi:hypothetical protein